MGRLAEGPAPGGGGGSVGRGGAQEGFQEGEEATEGVSQKERRFQGGAGWMGGACGRGDSEWD